MPDRTRYSSASPSGSRFPRPANRTDPRLSGPGAAPGGGDVNTVFGGVYKDADKFNSQMKLVFISVGEAEKTNPVRETYRILKDHGIKNLVFYESPKTDHEWLTWRRSLREFAPLLFK